MRVVRHLARLPGKLDAAVLTLGNFDGVHLGHQAIIRRLVARAGEIGGRSVALTFEPHPLAVLAPERAPPLLQSLHDRLVLMRDMGVDVAVLQRFTLRFAALAPEEFVETFLLRHLDLRRVVVGYNVTFGRNRTGTGETLRALGARHGFGVDVVGPVAVPGDPSGEVSSSRLRELIQQGDLPAARRLLGRPYALRGRVVAGDRRGRTLGFPTANLRPDRPLVLAPGVYVARASWEGGAADGVVNVGYRPTFGENQYWVEAYLLDFSGEIYDRTLRLEFLDRIRPEMKFSGVDALKAQVMADIETARAHRDARARPS